MEETWRAGLYFSVGVHSDLHPVWPLPCGTLIPKYLSKLSQRWEDPLPVCRCSYLVSSRGNRPITGRVVLSALTRPVTKWARKNWKDKYSKTTRAAGTPIRNYVDCERCSTLLVLWLAGGQPGRGWVGGDRDKHCYQTETPWHRDIPALIWLIRPLSMSHVRVRIVVGGHTCQRG